MGIGGVLYTVCNVRVYGVVVSLAGSYVFATVVCLCVSSPVCAYGGVVVYFMCFRCRCDLFLVL